MEAWPKHAGKNNRRLCGNAQRLQTDRFETRLSRLDEQPWWHKGRRSEESMKRFWQSA